MTIKHPVSSTEALDTPLEGRELVLRAAGALLDEAGPQALTMGAVAARAGVSRATLYRRFGTKDALLDALGSEVDAPPSARDKVLEAMQRIVGVEGKLQFTVEEVASAAGVSAMTIYRAFGDRAGLLESFLDEATPRARARRVLEQRRPIEEVLFLIASSAIEFASRNPGLLMSSMTAAADDPAIERFRGSDQSTRKMLLRYFRRAQGEGWLIEEEATRVTAHWMALVFAEGVLLPRLDDSSSRASIEERARRVVGAFLRLYGASA